VTTTAAGGPLARRYGRNTSTALTADIRLSSMIQAQSSSEAESRGRSAKTPTFVDKTWTPP
jgi:hypothetical protein